jgi:hypothetical protein
MAPTPPSVDGSASDGPSLSLEEAHAFCVTLRSVASTIRSNLAKQLQVQLRASTSSEVLSIDKSGGQIQSEALTITLLTHGRASSPAAHAWLMRGLRAHDADAAVAEFLQYWGRLSLIAGVCAAGEGEEVSTQYVDWYRGPPGQARFMPGLAALRAPGGLESFILQGWMPRAPPIERGRLVTALGSCFADELRLWLRARGFLINDDFRTTGASYPHVEDSAVPLLQCSAGLVNTFVLRQQFEWAFEGRSFDDDLWVGARGSITLPTEAARARTRDMFEATSLFVITLGLAEVWYQRRSDRPTCGGDGGTGTGCAHGAQERSAGTWEEVLWRAVPSDRFDPSRHGFRVSSTSENVANLRRMVQLIRRNVPAAKIVLTVSPIPLAATFRGVACVTANAASKAIMRAAVDELLIEHQVSCGRAATCDEQRGPEARLEVSDRQRSSAGESARRGGASEGGVNGKGADPGTRGGDLAGEIDGDRRSTEAAEDGAGGACADSYADEWLYYWPAYEMVKEGFVDAYYEDGRHVKREVVEQILSLFGKYFCPQPLEL